MPTRRRTHDPADSGRPAGPRIPSFAADPVAWFDAVDALLPRDPEIVRVITPETWTDPDGHHWRVVRTHDGAEVRPGLQSPFIVRSELPRISAILVTPERLATELTMRDWREVVTLRIGQISLVDLGLAMLTGMELPHEGLERLGPDVWSDAAARWARRHSSTRVGFRIGGHESLS
jgi:hypothetical protein